MKLLLKIVPVALAAFLSLQSCGDKGLIPRGTMSEIYADMFIVDQWFRNNQKYSRMTDTLYVYEPILEKYGYTMDEYMRSEDYYMNDTERYIKILKKSRAILEGRSVEVIRIIQEQEKDNNALRNMQNLIDSLDPIHFLAMYGDTTKWIPLDSVGSYGIYADTVSNSYDFVKLRDTLYAGGELLNIQ